MLKFNAKLKNLYTNCIYNKLKEKMGLVLSTRPAKKVVDMSSPKATEILDMIKKDKVVIFSKSYCPYCVMAKEQFEKLSVSFVAVELDKRDDCEEIQSILQSITGGRTVPRVFVGGKFIGGGTDVKAMYTDGSLKKLFD